MSDDCKNDELREIIGWLEQALNRLKKPSKNANGGDMQTGGAYWRLAKALAYLDDRLDEDEGEDHAHHIRVTHGVLTPLPKDDDDPSLVAMNTIIVPAIDQIRSQYGDGFGRQMVARMLLMLGTDYIAQSDGQNAAKFFMNFAQMALDAASPSDSSNANHC